MSAAAALQRAIFETLSGDAALSALVGPAGISDRLLDRQRLPLVVIAAIDSRDLSTATEDGEAHLVTLQAWSKAGGHRQVQAISARVRAALRDAALPLDGFHLVSLLHVTTRIARDGTKAFHHAEMRFRAVTE